MIKQYTNLNNLDMAGKIEEDIKNIFLSNNKERTLEHSINVAKTSVIIAEKYSLDRRICETAGYLHDMSAIISPEDMLQYARCNHWYYR